MRRTAVNPWDWSLKPGYNRAEVIEAVTRQVICAGQTAVDGAGHPLHPGDMRAQIGPALDNLEAVLAGAGMDLIQSFHNARHSSMTGAGCQSLSQSRGSGTTLALEQGGEWQRCGQRGPSD